MAPVRAYRRRRIEPCAGLPQALACFVNRGLHQWMCAVKVIAIAQVSRIPDYNIAAFPVISR